ncbi:MULTISPECIES: Gfo/Idh/MocA family protein [unclassified Nocardioides]|uniref:Gfo/Idh/MocA family protein n=1 Tax=unclassified Nocardioides TaxID=2615069 RepID=UPI0006F6ED3D|nr:MULTISPECIES: Gfo/Idh/MocA family oxidoreductase [unclassified Nocardioides]KRA29946.1 dehydrogenase [Nocardioides sp. Root614]KRA86867.1 dehydrogenase [Nocardioides sp. Root682]
MTLKAGLVGLGAMGRNHARILSILDDVDFIGAADAVVTDQRVSHGAPIVPDVDALIALKPDYVVVAAPTGTHEEIGLKLAAAGIHALIEKPLAPSVEGAKRLVDAFAEKGLVGGVGHIERYNPALQSLRTRLANGDLGEIYQVVTRRQGPFPGRIADVGVVKDLATHDIDLTAWVTGQNYVSVSARAARRSGREHEDLIVVVGELDGGAVVNHLVNWLSPLKERSTVITGERGAFVADTLTADLSFYANGAVPTEWEAVSAFRGVVEGDVTRFAIPKREPLLREHEQFRDAVLGKESDIVTLAQGMRTVEVAAGILASSTDGGAVRL